LTSERSSALSHDGRTLVSNGVLVDVATGKEMRQLEGVAVSQYGEPVVFSPHGALVAGRFEEVTVKDRVARVTATGVRLWEAATGRRVAEVTGGARGGNVVSCRDNRLVVTNDLQGVRLWDVSAGKALTMLTMPERVPSALTSGSFAGCLAVSADGRRLATGHPDGTILLWDLPRPPARPGRLMAKEVESLWDDLAGSDAARAWRAVWRLADRPPDA